MPAAKKKHISRHPTATFEMYLTEWESSITPKTMNVKNILAGTQNLTTSVLERKFLQRKNCNLLRLPYYLRSQVFVHPLVEITSAGCCMQCLQHNSCTHLHQRAEHDCTSIHHRIVRLTCNTRNKDSILVMEKRVPRAAITDSTRKGDTNTHEITSAPAETLH